MSILEEFNQNGFVVCRGLCESAALVWRDVARELPAQSVGWNHVEIKGPFPTALDNVPQHSELWNVASELLGDVAVTYNFRLLLKDETRRGPVFLHQDCGYHVGSLPKLSAFVALSRVIPENGGLRFWLGTHKYGYLGDCGEINPDIISWTARVCPVLDVGDVVFMHSALWHDSWHFESGPPRWLADVIYQRADDPSRHLPRDGIFKRSRVSRIQQLEREKSERNTDTGA